MSDWQDISTAPKDGTQVLAVFYRDLVERTGRSDLNRWSSRQCVLSHPGLADDGFDIGWGVAAPVGYGGLPDEWIEGWQPLPAPPEAK